MGIFSKLKCDECGKESRWDVIGYANGNEEKLLCSNCLERMHVSGFISYQEYIDEDEVDYPKICKYIDHYNSIINNTDYQYYFENKEDPECLQALTTCIGGLIINKNFITISGYQDLIIETKDIFAITMDTATDYSGAFHEAIVISFFTNNPEIPYFSTMTAGKVKLFSLSTKAKSYREALVDLLTAVCGELKYEIDSSAKLKKTIKNDPFYTCAINKKRLIDLLGDASLNSGKFKEDKVAKKLSELEDWAMDLNLNMGYIFIADNDYPPLKDK